MNIGKITGLPIKVLSFCRVCLPGEYLRQYGLCTGSDVSVEIGDSWLKISAYSCRECAKIALQKNQVIQIPMVWAQRNHIKPGDFLLLLGISDGLILYTRSRNVKALK